MITDDMLSAALSELVMSRLASAFVNKFFDYNDPFGSATKFTCALLTVALDANSRAVDAGKQFGGFDELVKRVEGQNEALRNVLSVLNKLLFESTYGAKN